MNESEYKCPCPLCGKDITDDDCFMISFVAEESAPDDALPDFVDHETVKKKKNICIGCKYHPQ